MRRLASLIAAILLLIACSGCLLPPFPGEYNDRRDGGGDRHYEGGGGDDRHDDRHDDDRRDGGEHR